MLIKGEKADLNLNAVGGYYSSELSFLVNHPTLRAICPSRGGRKTNRRKTERRKTKRRTTRKINK